MGVKKIQHWVVKTIYADHNSSRKVKNAIASIFERVPEDYDGLNIGAGLSKVHPKIKTLEIEAGEGIDYVGSVEALPLDDNSLDLVVTQEVLEHVENPFKAMTEIARVLRPGAIAYIQMPFTIGYHGCPNDYWRFTHQGMEQLAKIANLEVEEIGKSVGPAVGFYRILVEFFAGLFSTPLHILYKPLKLGASILFYPIKWLDPLMRLSKESHRIPGGYFMICRKPD